MAVRKVSNRGGTLSGHLPSLKLGRMVAFESLLERDFIYLLDFELAVDHFSEQPLVIRYQDAGKMRKYTPDFQVIYRGRPFLFECKPVRFVNDPENQIKFAAARLWCQEQRWTFSIVTDEHLTSNWRIANIKMLTQFARYMIEPQVKKRVFTFLASASGPVKISDVMFEINPKEPQASVIPILHMVFHHEVHVSLNHAKITVDSLIALSDFSGESVGLLP